MGARLRARAASTCAPPPWPRMTFAEAVSRYGIDRPDTRFGLELHDLGEALGGSEFKVFAGALARGGVVRGINAGARELPRSELDALTELAKQHGAKGLVWAFVQDDGGWRSPIAKFLSESEIAGVIERLDAHAGRPAADRGRRDRRPPGRRSSALRLELGRRFELIPEGRHDILWVVEFPAFFWDARGAALGRRCITRSPPRAATSTIPAQPRARAPTTSCSTARRSAAARSASTAATCSSACSSCLASAPEEAQARFGFLLDALRYGAPPHGGIAMGIDRIVTAARRAPTRSAT